MTRVKICGITNSADALGAAEAGADLLGFVFYPPSPRAITPIIAASIARAVRVRYPSVLLVGVFVDETPAYVADVAERCGLGHVQLHGAEPPEVVDKLMARDLTVIKGFRVRNADIADEMSAYRSTYYLLDTYVPDRAGGTGEAFDWHIARSVSGIAPILLAGGLTPENVGNAVRVAAPWGVDVSSGVEEMPGRKDAVKVRRFIAAAKDAAAKAESR